MSLHVFKNRSELLLGNKEGAALKPKNAAAAIIKVDQKYLLQHRDPIPTIFYPDHWGFFGGAIEEGESYEDATIREISEELCLTLTHDALARFMTMDFALDSQNNVPFKRVFFTIELTAENFSRAVLCEGMEMRLFTPAEIFDHVRVTPYDEFALWWHVRGK